MAYYTRILKFALKYKQIEVRAVYLHCNVCIAYTQYMTSLYYVTEHIKLVGKWGGIILAGIIALIFLTRFFFYIKNIVAPTPQAKPSVSWGKLPPLQFPPSNYLGPFTYTINTLSGELPQFPDRMTVNIIATPEASLQSLSNAKELTQRAGFDQEEVRISESTYQWIKPEPPQQKIQYDIVSKNFSLTSNYMLDQDILLAANLPDDLSAQQSAEDFLGIFNAFPSDFEATKSAVTFYVIQNGSLAKTTSLSNAQIIRVDFFQKDVNNYPIYYPAYFQGETYVLVGSGDTIVESTYNHHTISDMSATYPILTANEALELLKKGEGYVANHTSSNTNIAIQNVKLGYYLDKGNQTYLMPIFIFEGNEDFIAYVPAVTEAWINK